MYVTPFLGLFIAWSTLALGEEVFLNPKKTEPPRPDPEYPIKHTTTPRLGDTANFSIHCLGDPKPALHWWHDGQPIESIDSNTTCGSIATVDNVHINDFGLYLLQMKNVYGQNVVDFEMVAEGPPEPISMPEVSNVTDKSANITFVSGFDYNDTQTFLVMRDVDSQLEELVSVKGKPDDKGTLTSVVIKDLEELTTYNITIVSRNSHGTSAPVSSFVSFKTCGSPKPDQSYQMHDTATPRLGQTTNFTMHCLGDPKPTLQWWRFGGKVHGLDSNSTCSSTITFNNVTVGDFGEYLLEMENLYGQYTVKYKMIPDGPPDPVTDLKITDFSTTTASTTFTTGYNYNKTQEFVVIENNGGQMLVLAKCPDTTNGNGGATLSCELEKLEQNSLYNISVMSESIEGASNASREFVQFSTYGRPMPNPNLPDTYQIKPRLGEKANLMAHTIGNPAPEFEWTFHGKPVKSDDTESTSCVTITGMSVDDYGNYTLMMTNSIGRYDGMYAILADGPPAPASDLSYFGISENSVYIQWAAGFDYGSNQTIKIMQKENNDYDVELGDVKDITDGHGGQVQSTFLDNLASGTNYSIYLISTNARGNAPHSNTVQFTTKGRNRCSYQRASHMTVYVIGGLVAVLLSS